MTSHDTFDLDSMKRRRLLSLAAGATAGAVAIGGFAGSALAWGNPKVEFKGCSEVWIVAAPEHLKDGSNVEQTIPPTTHVIAGTPDGDTDCREVRATHQNATEVPGQYGDDAVIKYRAGDGEKILAVILYNRQSNEPWSARFDDPYCYYVIDHRCANNPDAPSYRSASCFQTALENGTRECDAVDGNRPPGDDGNGKDNGEGQGKGNGGPNNGIRYGNRPLN